MKIPTTFTKTILLLAVLLVSVGAVAQTLNRPVPIKNPNFGGTGGPWTSACPSISFNEYYVNFTWVANPNVNSDNTFVLELSNGEGDFTNPTALTIVSDKNNDTNFDIRFVLPTTTRGSNYKLRVKSTSPVLFSPETAGFNMYYLDYRNPIRITENGRGVIGNGTISLCNGGTATIAIDNVPNADTYQYIWRRSSTVLPDKGPSITVSQGGMYTVEIDYGPVCSGSAGTLSNMITVEVGTALGVSINAPRQTSFCAGETAAPLEATLANSDVFYTWFKDGNIVSPRTRGNFSFTIDTNLSDFDGDYSVKVEGDGICSETTAPVSISKTGAFTITEENALDMVLLPGETKTLSISTTAVSPTYQWFRNGSPIANAINNSLVISADGAYNVQVSQGGTCAATTNSKITNVVAPERLELAIDYTTQYSDCQNSSIVIAVQTINAISTGGTITNVTTDLRESLNYVWQRDGVDLRSSTTASLSLSDISENGTYNLTATIEGFSTTSNSLNVVLRTDEVLTIAASDLTVCNTTDQITLNTSTDLAGETFQWLRNGAVINSTDASLQTTEIGTYQLLISREGCLVPSNEVIISPFDESLITLDSPEAVVFVEGSSKTITASGGTAYEWTDSTNNIISSSNAVTLTTEGNYTLTAYIDACVVIKSITVTYRDTFRIPNVITVNGDGINDFWFLPNSFSNQPDVNVIIFNDRGEEVFNVTNYQNNWPENNQGFTSQNMIFYYTIKKGGDTLRQGTITVIK